MSSSASKKKPVTRIGTPTSDTHRLFMRGKDTLSEVVGRMSFAEAFYFIVTGKTPDDTQHKVMDAALVMLMDHGITPTAMVARLIADSLPDQPQIGVGAGIMMVGDKFAGTMAGAGAYLTEGVKHADSRQWAARFVEQAHAAKRRLPGFGHPYYTPTDPRSERLFAIAKAAGVEGRHIALIKTVGEELNRVSGKPITLNATGALGAILCEISFPVAAMRGLATVSRAAGLVAHVAEENIAPIAPSLMEFAGTIDYEDPAQG
jgi:citrate synthase